VRSYGREDLRHWAGLLFTLIFVAASFYCAGHYISDIKYRKEWREAQVWLARLEGKLDVCGPVLRGLMDREKLFFVINATSDTVEKYNSQEGP
jgi:hypothetical protein